jgi:hypothetical protein
MRFNYVYSIIYVFHKEDRRIALQQIHGMSGDADRPRLMTTVVETAVQNSNTPFQSALSTV